MHPWRTAQAGLDSSGGYRVLDIFTVDGARLNVTVNGTLARVDLRAPLAPHDSTLIVSAMIEVGF